MNKQVITIPTNSELFAGQQAQFDTYGFVPAVRTGQLLFISGQTALRADGTFPDDIEEQTRDAFARIFEVLRWVGLTTDSLVDIHSTHVDIEKTLDPFVSIKKELLPDNATAWTATGVVALGLPGLLIEVRGIATFAD